MKPLGLVHIDCQRITDPRQVEADAGRLFEHSPGWDLAVASCPACGLTFTALVPRRAEIVERVEIVETVEPVEEPRDLTDDELPGPASKLVQTIRRAGRVPSVRGTAAWVGVRVDLDGESWVALWTDGKRTGTWRLDGIHRHAEPARVMAAALKALS